MYTVYSVRRLELKIIDHLTRIRAIEDYIDKVDRKYKVKVVAIDAELVRIEEFCCGEVVEFKTRMKNKAEKEYK
jgi:2-phosphoglycerate kinase